MTKPQLSPQKLLLLHKAIQLVRAKTIADIGGAWGVNGAYIEEALLKHELISCLIVDDVIDQATHERFRENTKVRLVEGNAALTSVAESVGKVDLAVFFDVLHHQHTPSWRDMFALWALQSNAIAVHTPIWTIGDNSVSFSEHGPDWYIANGLTSSPDVIRGWFKKHKQSDPKTGRLALHDMRFWHVGIADRELIDEAERAGFTLAFRANFNPRTRSPWIENRGYIFVRGS